MAVQARDPESPEMDAAADSACIEEACPVARAVAVLDGKWTLLIVRELLRGTRRFSELRNALAGVSPKTLTDRLRSLEQDGVVDRVMYAEIPPRVEYSLTERGRRLEPVLSALGHWGDSLSPLRSDDYSRPRTAPASMHSSSSRSPHR
jgi:DNA-binding HxlR family transcriptional regulator